MLQCCSHNAYVASTPDENDKAATVRFTNVWTHLFKVSQPIPFEVPKRTEYASIWNMDLKVRNYYGLYLQGTFAYSESLGSKWTTKCEHIRSRGFTSSVTMYTPHDHEVQKYLHDIYNELLPFCESRKKSSYLGILSCSRVSFSFSGMYMIRRAILASARLLSISESHRLCIVESNRTQKCCTWDYHLLPGVTDPEDSTSLSRLPGLFPSLIADASSSNSCDSASQSCANVWDCDRKYINGEYRKKLETRDV